MAFTNINAYDADVHFPQFFGLSQYGDPIGGDPRTSPDALNVDTRGGVLQPCAKNTLLAPMTEAPIETLMRLHNRWQGDETIREDVLIAAAGGRLWYLRPKDTAWRAVGMPEETEAFESNVWSWVTYEIGEEKDTGEARTIDVLLISNAEDGMYMVRGDTMEASPVKTPYRFGVIERYAERIWGGAITDEPDYLCYSAPYAPDDWAARDENPVGNQKEGEPEDGGGVVEQPSWDGDSFTALRAFGSQLIGFKRQRVWRVLGTDPGTYEFREQYGGGMPYPNTIAVDAERIYGLTSRGVAIYDGSAVSPFQQTVCCEVWQRLNQAAIGQAAGVLFHGKYYLALPLDGSAVNNHVLIYDGTDGTWLLRDDLRVESFLATEETLYYTSSTTPGQIWKWEEDAWLTGEAAAAPTRWVTPWVDLGYKKMNKGPFRVYLLAEVQKAPVTFRVSIQTEKKTRTREIRVDPMLEWEERAGQSEKEHMIHFAGEGRRFRLILETEAGQPVWRMISGITVVCDVASD